MVKIIIVNFKCYKEATGKNAEKLVKMFEVVAKKYSNIKICVAPQAADIYRLSKITKKIIILGQHADSVEGQFTGHTSLLSLKESGAKGVILNHSEKQIPIKEIESTLRKAKDLGMKVIICAKNDNLGVAVSRLKPDYVAIEPPELIGGNISVSKANPNLIRKSFENIKSRLIVGAGVKNQEDVRIAVKLGAIGILVASGVVLSKNPEKVLEDLCQGFSKF